MVPGTKTPELQPHEMLERSLTILNALSHSLLSVPPGDFLRQVAEEACGLLLVPVCVVWRLDEKQEKLRIVAAAGAVDEEFKKTELDRAEPGIQSHLSSRRVTYLPDVSKPHQNYGHSTEAQARGWVSLLSAPMWVEDRLIGMLDVYSENSRSFKEWEKELFGTFANHAALSIQKAESWANRKQLEKLTESIQEMTEDQRMDSLLQLILDEVLTIVGATRGWIRLLDFKTGDLRVVAHHGNPSQLQPLKIKEGITGRSLQDERPIRVDDVRSSDWQGIYHKSWEDTRSELAVPICINKARVRIGRKVEFRSKPIGVINLESPILGAFSQADEDILCSLARQVAFMIERLDSDRKRNNLVQIEGEIVGKQDWNEIIQIVQTAITDTLGYEYVNISLVIPELKSIRTEYITGIPEPEVEEFKKMANHSLDSNDIQADIVRTKQIEVPNIDDKRLDHEIRERFMHDRLIRVFIPMIDSDNRVIGTVEAGYEKGYRKYIYEQDVNILKRFVDYAVQALEQRKWELLEQVSHEFTSAIVGIRSHASFLQNRFKELDEDLIDLKFDDILTDCELLLFQVKEVEYILGRASRSTKIEKTLVFRDVVIKTVNQLKPLIREQGFDNSKITVDYLAIQKIGHMWVDKSKLNQVVYNLLMNSIKYSQDNPAAFQIRIDVDQTKDSFIIKFKDGGMGIKRGFEERIFEEKFRTPEATGKNVSGSGLGLTIARKIMRELGGDLILANNYKPTEFHMVLPKSLKEVPHDTLRRR